MRYTVWVMLGCTWSCLASAADLRDWAIQSESIAVVKVVGSKDSSSLTGPAGRSVSGLKVKVLEGWKGASSGFLHLASLSPTQTGGYYLAFLQSMEWEKSRWYYPVGWEDSLFPVSRDIQSDTVRIQNATVPLLLVHRLVSSLSHSGETAVLDEETLKEVLALTSSGDLPTKLLGIQWLGYAQGERVVATLLPFLKDSQLRNTAIQVISQVRDPKTLQPLREALETLQDPKMAHFSRSRRSLWKAIGTMDPSQAQELARVRDSAEELRDRLQDVLGDLFRLSGSSGAGTYHFSFWLGVNGQPEDYVLPGFSGVGGAEKILKDEIQKWAPSQPLKNRLFIRLAWVPLEGESRLFASVE